MTLIRTRPPVVSSASTPEVAFTPMGAPPSEPLAAPSGEGAALTRAVHRPGPSLVPPSVVHRVHHGGGRVCTPEAIGRRPMLEEGRAIHLCGRVVAPYNLPDDVAWVQAVLTERELLAEGEYVPGQMNSATASAIERLQDEAEIPGDGVISPGRSTNRLLAEIAEAAGLEPRVSSAPVRPPRPGDYNDPADVQAVQEGLVAFGALAESDFEAGVMNAATGEAILAVQSHFMHAPDGVISPDRTTNRFLETPRERWSELVPGDARFLMNPPRTPDAPVLWEAIDTAARGYTGAEGEALDLDEATVRMLTIASIESNFDVQRSAGSYQGLFQISEPQFLEYVPEGDVLDPIDNARAAVAILNGKAERFETDFGRPPSLTELYLLHQQGEHGLRLHVARGDAPAWINMNMAGMLEIRTPQERAPLIEQWVAEGRIDVELGEQLRRLPVFEPANPLATAESLDSGWGIRATGGNLTRLQRAAAGFPANHEITGDDMVSLWDTAVRARESFYQELVADRR